MMWIINYTPAGNYINIVDEYGDLVCMVASHDEREARAFLIAAAPELKVELANLVAWIEEMFPQPEDQPDLSGAKQALAATRPQEAKEAE